MIPFFIIFVAFIIILSVQIHRSNRAQEEVTRQFWEKENQANAVRKQDISNLDYITLPMELIPGNLGTLAETTLQAMDGVRMLNLTGLTNTDLKLRYGAANLETLSHYESAYVDMIAQLTIYARELTEAGDTDSAAKLLEFAADCGDDSRGVYLPLAKIYKDRGDDAALDRLMERAEKLESIGGTALLADLRQLREE